MMAGGLYISATGNMGQIKTETETPPLQQCTSAVKRKSRKYQIYNIINIHVYIYNINIKYDWEITDFD